jgi:hypothetical protein
MSEAAAKRIGRPTKAPRRGTKRVGLGLKVSAEIKRRLDNSAKSSGLSQSQEAERRIEMSYSYERLLGDLKEAEARIDQTKQRNVEAILKGEGWREIPDLRYGGYVWLSPKRLQVERTKWEDPNVHTPPAPPKLIADPKLLEAITITETIIQTIKTELERGRGS